MTADTQREALRALAEVWALAPNVRLGQLMAFLGFLGEDQFDKRLADIEDDEMMAILYRHKADLIARAASQPSAVPPADGGATVTPAAALRLP
jgi:hypothetical protein